MINKAFDRHFFTIGGAVKTSGGSLNLAKGQLAVVDSSVTTTDGAKVLSSFLGKSKKAKDLAIRVGIAGKEPNRSYSDKAQSTPSFALNEVKNLRVSAPKRTKQSVDEVVIGYDGFDASTAFKFKTGDPYFRLSLELKGGLLQYRGGAMDCEYVHVNIEVPNCDPFDGCVDCDTCTQVDCKAITLEAIERLKRKQLSGGTLVEEVVDITPVFSCDTPASATLIPYDYYTLDVCDAGGDEALALVAAQYNAPVIRINRKGSTSTYQILLKQSLGAPADYAQSVASIIKGCEACPAGYSEVTGGFVYAITIEDSGVDRSSVITTNLANAKYVTNTIRRASGNDAGLGFYTAVYSSAITSAEVASFVSVSTNARNTATVDLVGTVASVCENATVTNTAWVLGDTCNAIEETYSIVLPDNECGEDRLDELNGAYADLTVVIADSANSTRDLTLTGTSGTADITVKAVAYEAAFNTDLTTTAADFVADHAAALLVEGIVVTANAGVLTFEGLTADVDAIIIANTAGNLAGTLAASVALPAKAGCQTKYETTVVSNLVCEECDPVFLDYYKTKAPASYDELEWVKGANVASTPSGNCLCGIRIKGKSFLLASDEALRDQVGFTETSTQVRVSGGYPDEIREGIGTLPVGTYPVKTLSRWIPRTHLGGNLRDLEKEGRAYFQGEKYRHDYLGRVLRGETSNMEDQLTQYVQYTIEIGHEGYTQSFAGTNSKNIEYHIWVELGRHNAIENLLNDLAANAGVEGVQALAI